MERHYERRYTVVIDEIFNDYVVQCSSPATMDGRKARWVDVTSGNSRSVRNGFRIIDDRTFAWMGSGVGVTFDGCATFAHWWTGLLDASLIDPAPKPEYCAEPRVDCRGYDFMGDRMPQFEDLQVDGRGTISFVVRSKAFKDGKAYRVRSNDRGATWSVGELKIGN